MTRIHSKLKRAFGTIFIIGLWCLADPAWALRIKDVTHIEGVRENQLIGYGLVVGLDGTGDGSSTEFTVRSLVSYLRRNGITIDPDEVKVDNTAAVVVTANLPPFCRPGMRIDVTVSSIGDAENLQGGTLMMTPLKGPDGQVYAVAQGALSVGGFKAGSSGTSGSKNHTTAGKVPGGALIEQAPPTVLGEQDLIHLLLDNPDFTTARRIAEVVNHEFSTQIAQAEDHTRVRIEIPGRYRNVVPDFMAELERLPVHPDQRARVVIDERTGTVVMGEDVRISTLAIAHGSLSIQITRYNKIIPALPYTLADPKEQHNADVHILEEGDKLTIVPEGVSLGEVVTGLNAIGVTPRDLISILQSIKTAGALQAELTIH